jgi:hypothetical protein
MSKTLTDQLKELSKERQEKILRKTRENLKSISLLTL